MFNRSFLNDIRKLFTVYGKFLEEDFIIEEQNPEEDEEYVTLSISYRLWIQSSFLKPTY